jgi:hypothetical protein
MCTDPGRVPMDKEFDAPDNTELAEILRKHEEENG